MPKLNSAFGFSIMALKLTLIILLPPYLQQLLYDSDLEHFPVCLVWNRLMGIVCYDLKKVCVYGTVCICRHCSSAMSCLRWTTFFSFSVHFPLHHKIVYRVCMKATESSLLRLKRVILVENAGNVLMETVQGDCCSFNFPLLNRWLLSHHLNTKYPDRKCSPL